MPPRPLTEDDVQEFRGQLCQAAEQLFAEHGYEGVTLRALAAELGCSAMTPYRYFENKQAIYTAVREAAFERFGDHVEAAAALHADPLDRFRALSRCYVGFALSEPRAYRIMFEFEKPDGAPTGTLRCWAPMVATLEQAVACGQLRGDPLTLAHLAWISVHGLVTLGLSGMFNLGRSESELVEPMINHFLRGAGAPPDALDRENVE